MSRSQGACLVTNSELPSAFCLYPYSYAGSFVDVAWAFRLRLHMCVAWNWQLLCAVARGSCHLVWCLGVGSCCEQLLWSCHLVWWHKVGSCCVQLQGSWHLVGQRACPEGVSRGRVLRACPEGVSRGRVQRACPEENCQSVRSSSCLAAG